MLFAPRRPHRGCKHVECRAPEEDLLASDFNGLKGNAKRKRTKPTDLFGVSRPSSSTQSQQGNRNYLDVRYFGHSRSDSFDA